MRSRKTKWEVLSWILASILGMLVTGCVPAVKATSLPFATQEIAAATLTIPSSPTTTETVTRTPIRTLTDTQPGPTSTLVPGHIYFSPLDGIPIEQLAGLVSNKFSPPRLGSDDPHQGVDFSVVDQTSGIALSGNPVQAVLGGRVAGVIEDRFPYGNAILVESRLDDLSPLLLDGILLPTPAPVQLGHPILTCPELDPTDYPHFPDLGVDKDRSLYLIYAHLQDPPAFNLGDPISSLQILGAIGDSGNALNPHLHLELRVGSSDFQFPGMAHYDASASPEEMAYYCLWRVSEAFQLLDPMVLFKNE